ncbi:MULTISPECIES: O-acetyl-ADP-ribose deacetylase [unclassified Gilliamella]|uniref:O-acetyl-ADP-ribose deacetylase n=1 Tax=unclassified Gilliamella TaxID=2685620 RepID=UPI00080EC261|nr:MULTISPECIES: O-acetyl-ADP-ribose deacetylase [Gilliamella]MCX8642065.1 O-acetyl-ADP-ribose deacetylase [Gilliamella sp. B3835]MCX8707251.1 O-acetyl-ADP-ribose deacetylase [Gilliamella sp. B3783]MCX8710840.1 O-acetyl-ADP-ribose deacetylase [Gilliamella sp. B3780]MCX8711841.1 O-acetyl-ADP-ribose deacetylase [Gilliamella sp. B3468]MCX8714008.1 O-acetyl-ADP-ribose deacetylase [Gilliamella sp. B3781]
MKNKIELLQADITKISTDAIVNAANTSLLGGGGVDGAIHRAGGKTILEECIKIREKQGGCKVGEAVITTAGNLPAKYVIHTVGPCWNGGKNNEEELLKQAYLNSFKLASQYPITCISFPNISTGIYRFPKPKAAQIALSTINQCLMQYSIITKVNIVCFDIENYHIYQAMI